MEAMLKPIAIIVPLALVPLSTQASDMSMTEARDTWSECVETHTIKYANADVQPDVAARAVVGACKDEEEEWRTAAHREGRVTGVDPDFVDALLIRLVNNAQETALSQIIDIRMAKIANTSQKPDMP